MTLVKLAGRLGKVVGKTFKFETRTLQEVMAAIESNTGRFRSYLQSNKKRKLMVLIDGKEIDSTNFLYYDVRNKEVLIIPVLLGGAVMMGLAIAKALTLGKIATAVFVFVFVTVVMTAVSIGLSMLIAKLLEEDDPEVTKTSSYVFGGADNVTKQGGPIPVVYGRLMVGSRVASVLLSSIDMDLPMPTLSENSAASQNISASKIVSDGPIQI